MIMMYRISYLTSHRDVILKLTFRIQEHIGRHIFDISLTIVYVRVTHIYDYVINLIMFKG